MIFYACDENKNLNEFELKLKAAMAVFFQTENSIPLIGAIIIIASFLVRSLLKCYDRHQARNNNICFLTQ